MPSSPRDMLRLPPIDSHPVLIARKLLVLGTFLQGMPPYLTRDSKERGIYLCSIMTHAVDTATRLVTTNDELIGSVEGIECIMIEAMYHNYSGNLHRAWISIHRAVAIAQMLALHRGLGSSSLKILDPETRATFNSIQISFRLAQMDRYLSIMLGLPYSSVINDFSTSQALENCHPNGKLQRIHCVVAGNILEGKEDDMNGFAKVHEDDLLLYNAASEMPPQWWMIPNFTSRDYDETNMFRDTISIMDQFSHYHLLMRLHLPYMLCNSSEHRYNHSKLTVLNSAREILSRYLTFRTSNPAKYYCRGSDFLAFMAITAICFAHISSHTQTQALDESSNPGTVLNSLAHSRPSDRGSMERTLELIESTARHDIDDIAYKLTRIIKNILIIEASAASGDMYSVSSSEEGKRELDCDARLTHGGKALYIRIPYLGTINFEHGVISKSNSTLPDILPMTIANTLDPNQPANQLPLGSEELSAVHSENQFNWSYSKAIPSSHHQISSWQQYSAFYGFGIANSSESEPAQLLPSTEFTLNDDEWYLQGIDLAFFDSILRGQK
ncbi:acyl-CoA N-acyltransferase [Penicillium atrosanguineum]|uniref:Transcription factor domain-containing protein n=1 Tax=Penicillium atrosanguineum TaxID=1132637 RepID=A0A9W9PTW2_9EURO|nr:acyl-CoA N-acyltransferase [Penicillium atrosanguineum]KAJ5128596.1 hypothetical protein N7526_006762 [Penicillium atrosanguineum]KAJ5300715.1 acyl-CoA N-acyltransferase [Penicillium atrosanguineum]KAJ5311356.1 hypothetical protein N7476_007216 [Penicillium atrosanguineum]